MQTEIVNKYRFGLITWAEMQSALDVLGYKMIDPAGDGNYYIRVSKPASV